jgi:hypothetical protein
MIYLPMNHANIDHDYYQISDIVWKFPSGNNFIFIAVHHSQHNKLIFYLGIQHFFFTINSNSIIIEQSLIESNGTHN